jgi:PAS domain S-box-containing protein
MLAEIKPGLSPSENRPETEAGFREFFGTQAFLASIVESSDDSIIGTDLEGNILTWNQGAERLFGYTLEEALGKHITMLFPQDRYEDQVRSRAQIRSQERIERFDSVRMGKHGEPIDVSVILSPIKDGGGNLLGVSAIYRDITEKKRAESELLRAKDAAEAANQAKSEFLANMSHEIRTPMNGIIGMTEVLLDTELTAEQREYLEIVKNSADLMLTVVNDILDFSKIEAGRLELDPVQFNLRDHIEETERSLALKAHEKGLELICNVKKDVPEEIVGDGTRIRQILVNLLGNAIKFTSEGEIELNVSVDSHENEKLVLHFSVRDTGIGIPPEKQEFIFDAFSQVDGSTTRKYGGTGLGLTISARLVKAMGGKIWVESEPGKGSRFHFTAALKTAGEPARKLPSPNTSLAGVRVLIVDDNLTNRLILTDLLRGWEMEPTAVSSGPEAVAYLKHAAERHEPYSLVLTDLHMPEMDGFTLVEEIQSKRELTRSFVLMLTSGEHMGDLERCRDLGISAYLIKPVRRAELRRAIVNALADQLQPVARKTAPTPVLLDDERSTPGSRRILVVEDNLVNQKVTATMLEKAGHTCVLASGGPIALELLKTRQFDMILMDVQMPGMDGFETTAAIRDLQRPTGVRTPIVAMTAHAMTGDRERCLEAGMDDYISKPIRGEELTRMIAKRAQSDRE